MEVVVTPAGVSVAVNKRKSKSRTASPNLVKKKKPITSGEGDVSDGEEASPAQDVEKIPVFKDPNFVHSSKGAPGNKKTRVWKNMKQIIAAERLLPWKPDDVNYPSIDAPPSFKPSKKYSDLSGLPRKYTDPQTKLRYTTPEEYSRIKLMPSDLVTGCLALRRANPPVP
ncbi:hypothetical protein ScPMuIL_015969 [Solemya velum]